VLFLAICQTSHCLRVVPGVTHNMTPGDDPDRFVKNIYRVRMSRGKKGCYVFCSNREVADYLSRCAINNGHFYITSNMSAKEHLRFWVF